MKNEDESIKTVMYKNVHN